MFDFGREKSSPWKPGGWNLDRIGWQEGPTGTMLIIKGNESTRSSGHGESVRVHHDFACFQDSQFRIDLWAQHAKVHLRDTHRPSGPDPR